MHIATALTTKAAASAAFETDDKAAPDRGPFAALLSTPTPSSTAAVEVRSLTVAANDADHAMDSLSPDRALTFKTIGPRLIAARTLNGLTQQAAARLAGFANSTQWSLYESGRRAPPLYVMLRAAKTQNVSMDFIFGLSPDPERDARSARRNACTRAVQSMLTTTAEHIADALDSDERLIGPNAQNVRELLSMANALCAAVDRFHVLNVELFEEARGGSPVIAHAEQLAATAKKVGEALVRHDAFAETMRKQIAAISVWEKPTDEQCTAV